MSYLPDDDEPQLSEYEREEQRVQLMASNAGYWRRLRFRRLIGRESWRILVALLLCILLAVRLVLSPWPPLLTLRHLAAAPNCFAVQLMGLAPAHDGMPGYYPWHDGDNDGIACERYGRLPTF